MLARKALAGTAGAPKLYVEDVMSTYLYTGSGATKTITNDIDLSGEGGMVWIKARSTAYIHCLYDTERGALNTLTSNTTDASISESGSLTAFNADGFTLGSFSQVNHSSNPTYVAWTFRQAKKFFDVVTYTGNGVGGRTVAHNLGSTPGCILIKSTSAAADWAVWHRGDGTTAVSSLSLNTSDSSLTSTVTVNSTEFSTAITNYLGAGQNVNGRSYVAYLFAHDAGGFGDAGSDSIIKCGSYTGNGSTTGPTVTLDWEPQWLMIKASSTTGSWQMIDNMRGMVVSGNDQRLIANSSSAELSNNYLSPTATGFELVSDSSEVNGSSQTYIYIAIRRGPMKTPTTGTSVFGANIGNNVSGSGLIANAGFPVDAHFEAYKDTTGRFWFDRLRGDYNYLSTASTAAETAAAQRQFANMSGAFFTGTFNFSSAVVYDFRRAPGFFDVVCYTGTGSATTISHNLGVTPQLMIVKCRSTASTGWIVYDATNTATNFSRLDTTQATSAASTMWNNTSPTASVFSVGTHATVNNSGDTYVAYLFASVSGVSKVGSYTGNGSSVTVTTDFQPRFIMVKRTDSTGDWLVSDSARGLVAGNDPYLELNTTDAEVTNEDWVDVSSTGFTVNQTTNNANVNTGTYIYLAIA
jgi:hypothetical protein